MNCSRADMDRGGSESHGSRCERLNAKHVRWGTIAVWTETWVMKAFKLGRMSGIGACIGAFEACSGNRCEACVKSTSFEYIRRTAKGTTCKMDILLEIRFKNCMQPPIVVMGLESSNV